MLLPRGGYDFTQVSPTEYRWSDSENNRSALVLAPDGARFGWYYHVRSASPTRSCLGRKSSIEAAFRKTVRTLNSINRMAEPAGWVGEPRCGDRLLPRLLDAQVFLRLVRARFPAKAQNG